MENESFLELELHLANLTDIQLTPDERSELLKQHDLTEICQYLRTNLQTGLSSFDQNDLNKRRSQFGSNELLKKKSKSFLELVWLALHDKLLVVLLICALFSIVLSFFFEPDKCVCRQSQNTSGNYTKDFETIQPIDLDWIEGVAILIAVCIVVLVIAFNDWTKEKQFRDLQAKLESEHKISVLRDGHIQEIAVKELLVGDVAYLTYGNIVPADGLIIESNNLRIDESVLTGESDLVEKNSSAPIVFNSTKVMEGCAKFLVLAVGLKTQSGLIMTMLTDIDEQNGYSLLQLKLNKLAAQIGYTGVLVSIATVIALFVHFFATHIQPSVHLILQRSFEYIIIGITVLVVSIPEGLPLAVTLSLAYAVKKMIQDNNLVRHLAACETMGNATAICSDKTGTLTTNRMTVTQCYINKHLYKTNLPTKDEISADLKQLLTDSIAINSSYTTNLEANLINGQPDHQIGNKTECSLLSFGNSLDSDYNEIRRNYPSENFIHVYTFNSDRKLMATCVTHPTVPGGVRVLCKGASEIIIKKSKFFLDDDQVERIDDIEAGNLNKAITSMSSSGLRTIGIAYKDYLPDQKHAGRNDEVLSGWLNWDRDEAKVLENLTLICICGIHDPVRPEVPEAIRKCQRAGIVIRMITGDNVNTARSIARECGIIGVNDEFLVLEGKEFDRRIKDDHGKVSQEKFDQIWPNLRVLARSSPQNKYDLVKHMINSTINTNREVVAVTGDGTNDGPALKIADVGFAMGIQGTDIAKEASDIILTDDNFNSIVKAVMWGRNVYDAISKFIQFQLTVNVVAIVCEFIGACFGMKPLNSVQMLWINLIMDSLASLALATDPPTEDLLKRSPYGRTSSLISRIMKKNIFAHAFYQISVILFLLLGGPNYIQLDSKPSNYCECLSRLAPSQHLTLVFNTFVVMTLFNEINARKIHGEQNVFQGILKNYLFCIILLLCFAVQILIVNFGKYGFSCKALSLEQWAWSIGFGIGSLIWGQIITAIPLEKICLWRPQEQTDFLKIAQLRSESKRMGRIRWLRSYDKLQKEIRVIKAFKQANQHSMMAEE